MAYNIFSGLVQVSGAVSSSAGDTAWVLASSLSSSGDLAISGAFHGDGQYLANIASIGSTSDTQVLFNSSDSVAGSANFIFTDTMVKLNTGVGLNVGGKTWLTGALDVDGATTLNGAVTLGDAQTDITTVTGRLTASAGLEIGSGGTLEFAGSAVIDATNGSSQGNYVSMKDDLAAAWGFYESSNSYLEFVTTDDKEKISAQKRLEVTGAFNVSGIVTLDAAVTLGNGTGDDITITGRIAADVDPKTTNTYDLGASGLVYKDIWVTAVSASSLNATGPLDVDGDTTLNGDVTLGDASGDDVKVSGHLEINAGQSWTVSSSGPDYTLTEAMCVLLDVSSSNSTITLPAAEPASGSVWVLKNANSDDDKWMLITGSNGTWSDTSTIEEGYTYSLSSSYSAVTLVYGGENGTGGGQWYVF